MAAALRVLRRLAAASTDLLLPPSLPGPFPKLYAAASAESSILSARGVHSSPTLAPSALRRYCAARGGETAGGLASVRRAYASPPQIPSRMAVRHQGFTKGAAPSGVPPLRRASALPLFVPRRAYSSELDALNHLEREAWEYLVGQLPQMKKSVADMKRKVCIMIGMLGVSTCLFYFYLMVSELNSQMSTLEAKVAQLESGPLDDDDDCFFFGGDDYDDDYDYDDDDE